jgi:hypothetical protein
MRVRTVLLWGVFVVFAAPISILLALKSEGVALQYGILHGTPGLIVSGWLVPPSPEALAKHLVAQLAVDAPLWFLVICGSAVAIVRRRRRTKKSQ